MRHWSTKSIKTFPLFSEEYWGELSGKGKKVERKQIQFNPAKTAQTFVAIRYAESMVRIMTGMTVNWYLKEIFDFTCFYFSLNFLFEYVLTDPNLVFNDYTTINGFEYRNTLFNRSIPFIRLIYKNYVCLFY